MLFTARCRKSMLEALILPCYRGDGVINQDADRQKGQLDRMPSLP